MSKQKYYAFRQHLAQSLFNKTIQKHITFFNTLTLSITPYLLSPKVLGNNVYCYLHNLLK